MRLFQIFDSNTGHQIITESQELMQIVSRFLNEQKDNTVAKPLQHQCSHLIQKV